MVVWASIFSEIWNLMVNIFNNKIWLDLIIPIITGTILFYLINIIFSSIIEFRKNLAKTYSLLIYSQNVLQSSFNSKEYNDQFKNKIIVMQLEIREQWAELESKYYSVKWANKLSFFKKIPKDSDFKKIAENLLYLSNSNLFYNPKSSIIYEQSQNDLKARIKSIKELMNIFEKYKIKVKDS